MERCLEKKRAEEEAEEKEKKQMKKNIMVNYELKDGNKKEDEEGKGRIKKTGGREGSNEGDRHKGMKS